MATNLYAGKEYFLIRIAGQEIFINEPVNWDKVLLKAERDAELYGFNAEFIDGDIQLTFAYISGGGNELLALYKAEGCDGLAEFEFGMLAFSSRDRQFWGNVNLNTKVENDIGIECTVEKVNFEHLFRTRYSTKVSLNKGVSYDGDSILSPTTLNLSLHSKRIVKSSQAKSKGPQSAFSDPLNPLNGFVHYLQPDTTHLEPDELEGVQGLPFAVTLNDPQADQRYQYKAVEAGFLQIDFAWHDQGGVYYLTFGGSPQLTSDIDGFWFSHGPLPHLWEMFVWVERAGSVITKQFKTTVQNKDYFQKSNTFYVDVEKDDKVYVGIKCTHPYSVDIWHTDTYVNTVTFKQFTVAPASNCLAYRVYDFLDYLVATVTGKSGRVISNFYGPGGPAERLAITSGYALRKFNVSDDKPVQADLQNVITALHNIHNIGIGFKTLQDPFTGADVEYIFVEPMAYFFRRGIITIIRDAYDWSNTHDKDNTYNQVKIGYSTYAEKEVNTLDEFNTEQEWLTPIRTYKKELVVKSDFIASGYSIEIQRREQFKATPSTSLTNDDKLFIIAYTPIVEYPAIGFILDAANNKITFSRPVGLIADDNITLVPWTGGAAIVIRIASIDYLAANTFNTTGTYTTTADMCTMTVAARANDDGSTSNAFAERNQYFEKCDNVIDPASTYNLRITPHRNLYNFAPLLNIPLSPKPGTVYIQNTFSKNNGALSAKLIEGTPNAGAAGYREIVEKANILLSDFSRDSAVMSAEKMAFKTRLSYDVAKRIKAAMRDELEETDLNCGCIVAPDRDGQLWICTIISMTYNYITEEATLVTNKVDLY